MNQDNPNTRDQADLRRRRTDKPRDPDLLPQTVEAMRVLLDACRKQLRLQREETATKKRQARAHLRLVDKTKSA